MCYSLFFTYNLKKTKKGAAPIFICKIVKGSEVILYIKQEKVMHLMI